VDIDADLLPFACSSACFELATCHLLLAMCQHQSDNLPQTASTAAAAWRQAAALSLPAAWVPYRGRMMAECKRIIGHSFARHVVDTGGCAADLFAIAGPRGGPHDAVFDALQCATDAMLRMTLGEQWAVFERRGVATATPVSDMLAGTSPPEPLAAPMVLPPFVGKLP